MADNTLLLTDLEAVENLPTLPVVIRQILSLIGNPRSNMGQIAEIISKDPSISGRVVRLVNSAFYGMRGRTNTIQKAVVILGVNTVKNITLGASVIKTFENDPGPFVAVRSKFWTHSFAVAQASKLLAQKLKYAEPDDYFIAGLLHDIGVLIMDQFFHNRFIEVFKRSSMNKEGLTESELVVTGSNHCVIGEFIAQKWKIPPFMAHVMRYHHSPLALPMEAAADADKINVVHVTDALVRSLNIANFWNNWEAPPVPQVMSKIGLPKKEMDDLFFQVKSDVQALMREWGL